MSDVFSAPLPGGMNKKRIRHELTIHRNDTKQPLTLEAALRDTNAGGIFPRHLCGVPFVYHTKRRATAPDGENGARENENKTTYKSMTIEKTILQ